MCKPAMSALVELSLISQLLQRESVSLSLFTFPRASVEPQAGWIAALTPIISGDTLVFSVDEMPVFVSSQRS